MEHSVSRGVSYISGLDIYEDYSVNQSNLSN